MVLFTVGTSTVMTAMVVMGGEGGGKYTINGRVMMMGIRYCCGSQCDYGGGKSRR